MAVGRLRRLRADERGASHPFLTLGAILVFGLVSAGFFTALQTAMSSMQMQKVNTVLSSKLNELALREASKGYAAVAELPAEEYVGFDIAGRSLEALRTVTTDTDTMVATVSVYVPVFTNNGWADPAVCATTPKNCLVATEKATRTLSHTIPDTSGVTLADGANNIPPSNESQWLTVALGVDHTLALDRNGNVWAWGNNAQGQLGDGSTSTRTAPQQITVPDTRFVSVAAGDRYSLALDSDGHVWAWGFVDGGRLGIPAGSNVLSPQKHVGARSYTALTAGHSSACAADDAGALFCWGGSGHLVSPTKVSPADDPATNRDESKTIFSQVTAGATHFLALDNQGSVWAWGAGDAGQLGIGATPALVDTPRLVAQREDGNHLLGATTVTNIHAVGDMSFAVDTFGRLWAWGLPGEGMFGVLEGQQNNPALINLPFTVSKVTANATSVYALTKAGSLHSWGGNDHGQLGDGTTLDSVTPVAIAPDTLFIDVFAPPAPAAGGHTLRGFAIDTTHRVWSWGSGSSGAAWGDGVANSPDRLVAVQSRLRHDGGKAIVSVAARGNHVLAVDEEGSLFAWGNNTHGQLGTGTTTPPTSVAPVVAPYISKPVLVSVGPDRTHVVGQLGELHSAGRNNVGQLGTGNTSNRTSPTIIAGQYVHVASGVTHTLAVDRSGNVWAWGSNSDGQLGVSGSNVSAPTKVPFPAGTTFTQVAAGDRFSMALDTDGNVWTWGRNDRGQLGIGVAEPSRTAPTKIVIPEYVTGISAGSRHGLAVDSDKKVWGWGDNRDRQVVSGTMFSVELSYPAPTLNPHLSGVVQVAGADRTTAVLTSAGKVFLIGRYTDNDVEFPPVDVPEEMFSGNVKQIAAGGDGAIAVTQNQVIAFGPAVEYAGQFGEPIDMSGWPLIKNRKKVLYEGSDVTSVATGLGGVALVVNDSVRIISPTNTHGQAGSGSTGTPVSGVVSAWATASTNYADALGDAKFVTAHAGNNSSAAIDTNGYLWVWGQNTHGMLGVGNTANRTSPTLIASTMQIRDVRFGQANMAVLDVTGQVWQAGRTRTLPTPIDQNTLSKTVLPEKIESIAAGNTHTLAVPVGGGAVYGWGGDGETDNLFGAGVSHSPTPLKVSIPDVHTVAAGGNSSVFFDAERNVTEVWGEPLWVGESPLTGTYRDFALHTDGFAYIPAGDHAWVDSVGYDANAPTVNINGTNVKRVAAAPYRQVQTADGYVVALDADGNIWVWGAATQTPPGVAHSAPNTPFMLPSLDDAQPTFDAQGSPIRATTTWVVATLDPTQTPTHIQLNLKTDVHFLYAVITCVDGSRARVVAAEPSDGGFWYANITTTELEHCDSPTLSAVLNGSPLNQHSVTTLIVPLVYVADEAVKW